MPSSPFYKESVLITGAAAGLGRLLAERLARTERPRLLILWDVDEKGLRETAKQCEQYAVETFVQRVDLTRREEIYAAAIVAEQRTGDGAIGVLVNNAGVAMGGPFLEQSDAHIQLTIDVNLTAHLWTVKAFLPSMQSRGRGHIVSIASAAGLVGAAGLASYSASKWGAVGWMEALEHELWARDERRIKFTTVCPSYTSTAMMDNIRVSKSVNLLSPQSVIDRIVDGVNSGQRVVCMPLKVGLLRMVKGLLPFPIVHLLIRNNIKASSDCGAK